MSKSKDAEAKQSILDYLRKQNRPYSATDVFSNLHKAHGKSLVTKVLETLAAEGKLREKLYGKQKVYVADQNQYEDVPESVLKEMDQKIMDLNERLKTVVTENNKLDSQLNGLKIAISTEDAKSQLADLKTKIDKAQDRLQSLKNNDNSVSPEERTQIMTQRSKFVKEWRKRKRMTNDVLGAILEGYPKTKKALYEETGVETDEDYNVTVPQL